MRNIVRKMLRFGAYGQLLALPLLGYLGIAGKSTDITKHLLGLNHLGASCVQLVVRR
jgi:hypothetical protein